MSAPCTEPSLTPIRDYLAIVWRGFAIVSLVAANTAQIAGGHIGGAFIVGAAISWFWFGNARAAGTTDLRWAREAYSLGAASGTVFGVWAIKVVYGV